MSEKGEFSFKDIVETEGENRGRIKDKKVARGLANREERKREERATPEEANRDAEQYLQVRGMSMRAEINRLERDANKVSNALEGGYAIPIDSPAEVKGDEEAKKYKEFQAELDREELDKLRAKIKENGPEKPEDR